MNRYIILSIFFIISILLIKGCKNSTVIFKDYGYKRIFIDYDWGKFGGNLIGADEKIDDNNSIRGNKYELILYFTSNNTNITKVFIKKFNYLIHPKK